ncbi:hypothetical protein BDZ85DRAFT_316418, partial [Elsinoe ampelina]
MSSPASDTDIEAKLARLQFVTEQARAGWRDMTARPIEGVVCHLVQLPGCWIERFILICKDSSTHRSLKPLVDEGDIVKVLFPAAMLEVGEKKRVWTGEVVPPYPELPSGTVCIEIMAPLEEGNWAWSTLHPQHFERCKSYEAFRTSEDLMRYLENGPSFTVMLRKIYDKDITSRDRLSFEGLRSRARHERLLSANGNSLTADILCGVNHDNMALVDGFFGLSDKEIDGRFSLKDRASMPILQTMRQMAGGFEKSTSLMAKDKYSKGWVLASIASIFVDKRISPRRCRRRFIINRPYPPVVTGRAFDGVQYMPFTDTHRDTCLIMALAPTSANAIGLTQKIFKSMSMFRDDVVCTFVSSEHTDREIFMRAADTTARRLGPDHLIDSNLGAGSLAQDWQNHRIKTKRYGELHTRTSTRDHRPTKDAYYHSVGFAMMIAAGLQIPVEDQQHPYVKTLLRSPLRSELDRLVHFRFLYAEMSKSHVSEEHRLDFELEFDRVRDLVLRCSDAVIMTMDNARQPYLRCSLSPHIILSDSIDEAVASEIYAHLVDFPTARRVVVTETFENLSPSMQRWKTTVELFPHQVVATPLGLDRT